MDSLVHSEIKRYQGLKSTRDSIFLRDGQTISQYFAPQLSNINTEKTESLTGWTDEVYDTTGIEAARVCASGQKTWFTPSTEPWFAFEPPQSLGEENEDSDEAALWCARATEVALSELSLSNFYDRIHECYDARSIFATGCLFAEEGTPGSSALNFRQFKVGDYCIAENAQGIVDTFYREFKLTARQIQQQFPNAELS